MRVSTRLWILGLLLLSGALLSADGAGGMFYGFQYYSENWSSHELGVKYIGGYGYGAGYRGSRVGGFGFAMIGDDELLTGGFGGTITGQEIGIGPMTAAVNIWLGMGGVRSKLIENEDPRGYFALFGEINMEIGFALTPWFQVGVYGGLQGIGNVLPGEPFTDVAYYTPVIGCRLVWGSFRGFRWW